MLNEIIRQASESELDDMIVELEAKRNSFDQIERLAYEQVNRLDDAINAAEERRGKLYDQRTRAESRARGQRIYGHLVM